MPCSISVNTLLAESFTCRGCLVQRSKVPSAKQRQSTHTQSWKIQPLFIGSQLHLVADHFHLPDMTVGSVYFILKQSDGSRVHCTI